MNERWEAPCKWCGKSFARKRIEVVFCSDKCLRSNRQAVKLSHGESDSRLAKIWYGIRKRCKSNPRYAGRGIRLSDEWGTYEAFRKWSMLNGYKEHLVIDRIDNDGNYEPSNCRWITRQENTLNRAKYPRGSSKFRGVWLRKDIGKWAGCLSIDGKHCRKKHFNCEVHAAMHYDRECLRERGVHAKLNFPERRSIYLDEIASGQYAIHAEPSKRRSVTPCQ